MLRWIGPSLAPAILFALLVYLSDRKRHPALLALTVFVLGGVAKAVTWWAEGRAAAWTGLGDDAHGAAASALLLFGFAAPIREAAKVAAVWPVFRSRYVADRLDGVVYATAATLGFAAVETALTLRAHPFAWSWILRTTMALPAHLFFACVWGYALGRAKSVARPGASFPAAWLIATALHGVYAHLVFGRGAAAALVGALPMLLAMAVPTIFAIRELRLREERTSRTSLLLDRVSSFYVISSPPSLTSVREAMRRDGESITWRWILFGALVTVGAMTAGLAVSIAFGHWANVDFSIVDEHDVSTTAPVALLVVGVLLAFPLSGYLVARASSRPTLLEPAAGSGLAIAFTLLLLGFAAEGALVFALAFAPIAWGLACVGAWAGRP